MSELHAMAKFLGEIHSLCRSEMSDEEAVRALEPALERDPEVARRALAWLERAGSYEGPTFVFDRARRILSAAISHRDPEPASPEYAELFKREHDLARMTQTQAFAEIESIVPGLDEFHARADELAGSPDSSGIRIESGTADIPNDLLPSVAHLVGPFSGHPDPLVRSPVAAAVVSNYPVALITGTAQLALWDPQAPMRPGHFSGSLNS